MATDKPFVCQLTKLWPLTDLLSVSGHEHTLHVQNQYISPFKCSRKSKGLRSRSLLPSAFCFCLLLTSFLLVSEFFFVFLSTDKQKACQCMKVNFRQSLHWQAFCLSVHEFYIFLPVFDIILRALTSFLLVSEWKKYTASTSLIRLIWSDKLFACQWGFFL